MWEQVREFEREESKLGPDMHLVLALSFAIQARDEVEAKRLYDAMDEERRSTVDGVEALELGSMKIWLAHLDESGE